MSRARLGLAAAAAALALAARAEADGLPVPGAGTTPSKVEPATPLLRGLKDTLARREAAGLPVPSSVQYSYEVSGGAAPEAGLMAAGPAPVTVVGRVVLQLDSPEQVGYAGQWPRLVVANPSPPVEGLQMIEGDYTEAYRQLVAQQAPGYWDRVEFGREPRTLVVEETLTVRAPASPAAAAALEGALALAPVVEGATAEGVLMGFGYIGPDIDYTITFSYTEPVFGIEVFYVRAGFQVSWALGLRLPVNVALTGPSSIATGSSASFSSALSPRDWTADQYGNAKAAPEKGNEFVFRESIFVGLDVRAAGYELCRYCSIESNVDKSASFTTPFGPGTSFPFAAGLIKVPIFTQTFKEELTEIDILELQLGIDLTPTLTSTSITANASVAGGSASGGGAVQYTQPDVPVTFGVNACLKEGAARTATVGLAGFAYGFTDFGFVLGVYGSASVAELDPFVLRADVFSVDLSAITPDPYLGRYVECTTNADQSVTCAPPEGALDNALAVTANITDGDAPTTTLIIGGTRGNEGWYRSNLSLALTATDNPPGCGSGVFSTEYRLGEAAWAAYGAPPTLTTEGITAFSYRSTDRDGNVRTDGPLYLKVDKTPPNLSPYLTPWPNVHGWNAGDVTVAWSGSDAVSGLATVSGPQSFSSEGAGQVATGRATDRAGNEALRFMSVSIDKTAPTIFGAPATAPNVFGWHNRDVVVHFEASDALSGIDAVTPDRTLTAEGTDQSVTGTATDRAGNSTSAVVGNIDIDKTAPRISASAAPPANAYGWQSGSVYVLFGASDSLSGVNDVTPPRLLTAEGAGQSVTGTATDRAFNSASVTLGDINIDRTPPTLSGAPTTAPNANGWYDQDVVVHFEAADALSGIASLTPDQTLALEGADQGVTGTATDRAGHATSATVGGIDIDKTAPTLSGAPTTAPNAYGWYGHPVIVEFEAFDALSGIDGLPPGGAFLGAEGAGQFVTATVRDRAGNLAFTKVGNISIDRTAPTLEVLGPQPVAYPNTARLDVLWTASDAFSGVLAQYGELDGVPVLNGQEVDLVLFTPGRHLLHVTALDRADHAAEAVVAFDVAVGVDGLWAATDRVCELDWIDKYGICVSLWAKLDAAKASIERADLLSARGQLEAFLHELAAQWYKAVNLQAHEILTVDALYLLAHLG